MTNKKLLQIAGLVVAAVWVFCISLFIAFRRVDRPPAQTAAFGTTPAFSSSPSFSSASSAPSIPTTESSGNATRYTIDGNQVSASVSVGDPDWYIAESQSKKASEAASIAAQLRDSSIAKAEKDVPDSKGEIISAYVNAVNKLKKTNNFTLRKEETLNVEIDEITGGSAVENIASSLISNNTKTAPETYSFSNGLDSASGKTPDAVIAPLNCPASLSKSNVTSAKATSTGGGAYTLKMVLGEAVQTLYGPAEGYATSMEVINVDSLGLTSSMKITSLDIYYNNSVIEASIDKEGRITSMKHELIVSRAEGEGKYLVMPVSVQLHGDCVSSYSISY